MKIPRWNVEGPNGLILTILWKAVSDLNSRDAEIRQTAVNYFNGPLYKEHLEILDMPEDSLPSGFREQIMEKKLSVEDIHERIVSVASAHLLTYSQAIGWLRDNEPSVLEAYDGAVASMERQRNAYHKLELLRSELRHEAALKRQQEKGITYDAAISEVLDHA